MLQHAGMRAPGCIVRTIAVRHVDWQHTRPGGEPSNCFQGGGSRPDSWVPRREEGREPEVTAETADMAPFVRTLGKLLQIRLSCCLQLRGPWGGGGGRDDGSCALWLQLGPRGEITTARSEEVALAHPAAKVRPEKQKAPSHWGQILT